MINNKKTFFLLLICFFISRLLYSYFFNISLNGANFGYHTLHFDFLKNDLFQSLIYQHHQPFFWSLYNGLLIKLTNGNIFYIENIFLFINRLLSFGIIYYALLISFFFGLSHKQSMILFVILILNPTIYFYENLYAYHQLTAFLFTQACYFTFLFIKKKKSIYEFSIYITLGFLGFVWAAFQPVLIIFMFFVIRLVSKTKFKKNFFIFILIFLVSCAPQIKNKIVFGSFSSSSWSGHGFSTVFNPEWLIFCRHPLEKQDLYKSLYEEKYAKKFTHPSLLGPRSGFNNLGLVYKSDVCFSKTIERIVENPSVYAKSRFLAFLASHGKFAFDFVPKPKGWEINIYDKFLLEKNNKFKRQAILFMINLIIYATLLYLIFYSNYNKNIKDSLFIIAGYYSYLFLISFLFACCEQERMLYTGYIKEIIFMMFLINLFCGNKFVKKIT